jgi:diacylglycerol kinase (ATP)
MHVLIIGNPAAGRGQAHSRISEFRRIVEHKGHAVETFLTRGPGDAGNRAAQTGPEVERLVVAGGDGTLNEVLNGLPDPSRIPILTLSSGTANMLARDLRLPRSPEDLARVLEDGSVRKLDMGLVGEHRFLLLVTSGFDAAVTEEIRKRRGKRLGYRGYVEPVIRALARYNPTELTITVDGDRTVTGRQVMVLNVRHYGGLFVFWNKARLDSGTLDVCVFQRGSIAAMLRYSLAGLVRMVEKLPDVIHLTGRTVKIESRESSPVEVDGDYFGSTPQVVRLCPSVVPVLVPREEV